MDAAEIQACHALAKAKAVALEYDLETAEARAYIREEVKKAEERFLERRRRAEEEESEKRRKDEDHKRQLELVKAKKDAGNGESDERTFPSLNLPKVPPPKAFDPKEERIDEFFRRFESTATRCKWDEEAKLAFLMSALPHAEEKRIQQLPPVQQQDYKEIKEFLLRVHVINPHQRKEDFQSRTPVEGDPGSWFPAELSRAFDLWLEAAGVEKSYDALRNFMILDQLKSKLPPYLLTVLKEKNVKTPDAAGVALTTYMECRPQTSLYKACKGLADKKEQGSKENKMKTNSLGDKQKGHGTPSNGHSVKSYTHEKGRNGNGSGESRPNGFQERKTKGQETRSTSSGGNVSTQGSNGNNESRSRFYQTKADAISARKQRGPGCKYHGGDEGATHTTAECRGGSYRRNHGAQQEESWRKTTPSNANPGTI